MVVFALEARTSAKEGREKEKEKKRERENWRLVLDLGEKSALDKTERERAVKIRRESCNKNSAFRKNHHRGGVFLRVHHGGGQSLCDGGGRVDTRRDFGGDDVCADRVETF